MNYFVVSASEWTYPDVHSYVSGSDSYNGTALSGGYAAFQLHICGCQRVKVSLSGFSAEVYRQVPVLVEDNPGLDSDLPHCPERKAPFSVNDCLAPAVLPSDFFAESGLSVGLYFAVTCKSAGEICGEIVLEGEDETTSVPVSISVSQASLPAETLQIVMGFSRWEMAKRHGVPFMSDCFFALETKYMKALRRQHQNRMYIDPPTVICKGGDKYEFDYSEFNRQVSKALSMGFTAFNIHGIGFRRSWDAPDIIINQMDSLSWEAYLYLSQYMLSLKKNIAENGWDAHKMFSIGIADEPNDADSTTYGAIDIWVPRSDEFLKNRKVFDYYKTIGNEVWFYTCLFPRKAGFINRFLDIPLLATRYLYWGDYKYGLSGFLHWTVNDYQDEGDPLKTSCPKHVNAGSVSILPPGDDKLIYPGIGEPWISMRLESFREGAEEYEMLKRISETDKKLADSLCDSGFTGFDNVNYNPVAHDALRSRIISAYEKLGG